MTEALADELRALIEARIAGHERSQQVEIGASGLGTPCVRKLGFRLAHVPPYVEERAAWRPTVGTAVHTWLAELLLALNQAAYQEPWNTGPSAVCDHEWCEGSNRHLDRFLVELHTPVGTINGRTIGGSIDVYDRLTATIIDWKICGPRKIKDYAALIHKDEPPSSEYRVQSHTYGRGLTRAHKLPVENVMIVFLPMNGELKEMLTWSEPYDPEIGKEAFERARVIDAKVRDDPTALTRLKRTNDYCQYCPWFAPGEEATPERCPGAIDTIDKRGETFDGLI